MEEGGRQCDDVRAILQMQCLNADVMNRYFPVVAVVMFWPYVCEPIVDAFEGLW